MKKKVVNVANTSKNNSSSQRKVWLVLGIGVIVIIAFLLLYSPVRKALVGKGIETQPPPENAIVVSAAGGYLKTSNGLFFEPQKPFYYIYTDKSYYSPQIFKITTGDGKDFKLEYGWSYGYGTYTLSTDKVVQCDFYAPTSVTVSSIQKETKWDCVEIPTGNTQEYILGCQPNGRGACVAFTLNEEKLGTENNKIVQVLAWPYQKGFGGGASYAQFNKGPLLNAVSKESLLDFFSKNVALTESDKSSCSKGLHTLGLVRETIATEKNKIYHWLCAQDTSVPCDSDHSYQVRVLEDNFFSRRTDMICFPDVSLMGGKVGGIIYRWHECDVKGTPFSFVKGSTSVLDKGGTLYESVGLELGGDTQSDGSSAKAIEDWRSKEAQALKQEGITFGNEGKDREDTAKRYLCAGDKEQWLYCGSEGSVEEGSSYQIGNWVYKCSQKDGWVKSEIKETICNDLKDNDGDGKTDCIDEDCKNAGQCKATKIGTDTGFITSSEQAQNVLQGQTLFFSVDKPSNVYIFKIESYDSQKNEITYSSISVKDLTAKKEPSKETLVLGTEKELTLENQKISLKITYDTTTNLFTIKMKLVAATPPPPPETICNDLKDNDDDGKTDCNDEDCNGQKNSQENTCCRKDTDCVSGEFCNTDLLVCEKKGAGECLPNWYYAIEESSAKEGPYAGCAAKDDKGKFWCATKGVYVTGKKYGTDWTSCDTEENKAKCVSGEWYYVSDMVDGKVTGPHKGCIDEGSPNKPWCATKIAYITGEKFGTAWKECTPPLGIIPGTVPIVSIKLQEVCNNGIDDDGDGKTDCKDIDCSGKPGNAKGDLCQATEVACNDGFDNDANGKIDCAEPNCASALNCKPKVGDVSGLVAGTPDGTVNVLDVIQIVKYITVGQLASVVPEADVNCDGEINVKDVVAEVEAITQGKTQPWSCPTS